MKHINTDCHCKIFSLISLALFLLLPGNGIAAFLFEAIYYNSSEFFDGLKHTIFGIWLGVILIYLSSTIYKVYSYFSKVTYNVMSVYIIAIILLLIISVTNEVYNNDIKISNQRFDIIFDIIGGAIYFIFAFFINKKFFCVENLVRHSD